MRFLLLTGLTFAVCLAAWDFNQWIEQTVALPQPEARSMKVIDKWNAVCRVEKCKKRNGGRNHAKRNFASKKQG